MTLNAGQERPKMYFELLFHVVFCILLLVIYMLAEPDQLPRLRKRELICLLFLLVIMWFLSGQVFLFLFVLGIGCGILLWHSLGLPYNN